MIQLKVWLLLADIYLSMGQPNEAMFCIQEASQIYPLSHQIMYMVSLDQKIYGTIFLLRLIQYSVDRFMFTCLSGMTQNNVF